MAIVFGLPWALLMWSYVVPNLPRYYFQLISTHQPPSRAMNRTVTFFIALLFFSFTISNTPTRIVVCISSVMMAPLVVGCIWISPPSRYDAGAELLQNGLTALKRLLGPFAHFKQLLSRPLASHFAQPAPDDVRSVHSMAGRQDRIAV